MSEWLQTYNEFFGMYHAGIITSIFGAFAVTFTVLMSWPKLVKDFGPIGGFMAAALIIGTFWVVNHKLPGFGFSTGLLKVRLQVIITNTVSRIRWPQDIRSSVRLRVWYLRDSMHLGSLVNLL